jgi:acyl-CoA synthetase (NDP forming)
MSGHAVRTALRLVGEARARGSQALLEADGFRVLEAAGIRCPLRLYVRNSAEAALTNLSALGSDRAVVKVVAPAILHKSDVGGVAIVPGDPAAVTDAIRRMEGTFANEAVDGYSVSEYVPYDAAPGGEWLLGLRWTDEFGPVVSMGIGGVATEFLAGAFRPGREVAVFTAGASREGIAAALGKLALTPLVTGGVRRQAPRIALDALVDTALAFAGLSEACRPDGLTALEVNPIVVHRGTLVALDVLATVGNDPIAVPPPRPVHKIEHLLSPRSIAIAGVSATGANPGRVILQNTLAAGFDPDRITIVKPNATAIDGCRAVRSIGSLPDAVDLLVLSVPAGQVPQALAETIGGRRAESVIVIPGGFEEKAGTSGLVADIQAPLRASRETAWGGPVVNGGNCLGVQSRPGRMDSLFLPPRKLAVGSGPESPLALISQSGAFAASRISRLNMLRPRYTITVGNQMDLTIGDYLAYLEHDPLLEVFGLYVEGFRPLDGRAALDAIARITASGRTVVLYRAGRTPAGAHATASHTASVAGDYTVTRELAAAAGAIVAETLDDFTDLVMLFTTLRGEPVPGTRLGALSNAGYECVAAADALRDLRLTSFTAQTRSRLEALFASSRVDQVVDVNNPLDVTPMLNDAAFEAAVRLVLEDGRVDVGLIGCVPATPALSTLPASASHLEDIAHSDSIAQRLVRVRKTIRKPWVAVVDAGAIYDPFVKVLQEGGVPVFRAADRAVRLLEIFVERRFADTVRAQLERWTDEFGTPAEQEMADRVTS